MEFNDYNHYKSGRMHNECSFCPEKNAEKNKNGGCYDIIFGVLWKL